MSDKLVTLVGLTGLFLLAYLRGSPAWYTVVRPHYPVDLRNATTAIQTETTWRGSYFTDSPPSTRLGKLTLSISERRECKSDAPPAFLEFNDARGVLTLHHDGRPYEFNFRAEFVGEKSIELRLCYEAPKPHPLSVVTPSDPLANSAPPIPMVPAEGLLRVRDGQLVGTIRDAHGHLSAWVELEPDFPCTAPSATAAESLGTKL